MEQFITKYNQDIVNCKKVTHGKHLYAEPKSNQKTGGWTVDGGKHMETLNEIHYPIIETN